MSIIVDNHIQNDLSVNGPVSFTSKDSHKLSEIHKKDVNISIWERSLDNKIINGEKVYNNLEEIDDHIGIVNVFRPSVEAEEIAKQTKDIGAKVLWLQLNIHNEEAAKFTSQNKIYYVSNKCTK